MNPDVQMMVPISEANKDFICVMHMADNYGRVVILKDNNPKRRFFLRFFLHIYHHFYPHVQPWLQGHLQGQMNL